MRLLRIVRLAAFLFPGQKVQNVDKNACRQMFQALEPFRKEVVVDEPSKDMVTAVLKFFSCHKKYQHQEPLKDLVIPGMTIEEFWEVTKIIMNLSLESRLLQNKSMQNLCGP
jgi:hypothetical protein